MINQNKTQICPKCNSEFEVINPKYGVHFTYCENCRVKPKPRKNVSCLFCAKPLDIKHKTTKPFCGWNCELRHNIDIFQQRNKNFNKKIIIGCA